MATPTVRKLIENGYGQLELNFAAFRRYGAIEAQCRMADDIDYLENGMILVVDRALRVCGFPGVEHTINGKKVVLEGPLAINYTSEHMYDEREKALKDFKLDNNTFYPRLGYFGKADKFTTNTVCYDSANLDWSQISAWTREGGYKLYGRPYIGDDVTLRGYIEIVTEKDDKCVLEVLEATEMPDGQRAVKFGGLN